MQTIDGLLVPDVLEVQLSEVPTPGKKRAITIPSPDSDVLGPLHHTLYDALRRTPWLLVGPPTEERISSAMKGAVWATSVDLVNATDGLDLSITKVFLSVANRNAFHVPVEIMDFAFSSFNAMVESRMIQHGQMMGIYLSFPLLCCHSYTAARWASRDDSTAKYLVNGDDTVIAGREPVEARSYPVGYRLNDSKTMRSKTAVEVNSTVFLKKGNSWREVKNLRRGGFDPTFLSGMLHGAVACLGAGRVWVDAFMRSRIGSRWGLLPSQLGLLESGSYLAFKRERKMRLGLGRLSSDLPARPSRKSDLLRMCQGTPDPDEQQALIDHQWVFGREKQKREEEVHLRVGSVKKTYRWRSACKSDCMHCLATRRSFGVYSSYIGHLHSFMESKRRKVYFVPEEYTPWRERIGLMALDRYRV